MGGFVQLQSTAVGGRAREVQLGWVQQLERHYVAGAAASRATVPCACT